MTSRRQVIIDEAYNEAIKSPMNKKIGAILVYRNKIISRGHNYYNMQTVFNTNVFLFSTHAEVDCISKCKHSKKSKSVLYIIRVDNNGNIIPIKPCDNCKKIIDKYELKYICL
jgi:deoxycytidylate deaminase